MSAVTMHHFSGLSAPFVRSKGTVSGGVFKSYTGVLINRRRVMKDGKVSHTPEEQQLRHEGVYPVLICRERWEEVQRQLKRRSPRRPEGSNKPRHRYTGLLCCKECGSPFVPLRRHWNGREPVSYTHLTLPTNSRV